MNQIVHDRPEQLQMILSGLLQGEQVIAVYDCIGVGTGFIGLTNQRVILQDKSFVGSKVALLSLPYRSIQAISMLSNKSMLGKFASSSSIAVSAGSKVYEADFRGDEKAKHAHDVILWHIINQ
jgi:hypothetical protein